MRDPIMHAKHRRSGRKAGSHRRPGLTDHLGRRALLGAAGVTLLLPLGMVPPDDILAGPAPKFVQPIVTAPDSDPAAPAGAPTTPSVRTGAGPRLLLVGAPGARPERAEGPEPRQQGPRQAESAPQRPKPPAQRPAQAEKPRPGAPEPQAPSVEPEKPRPVPPRGDGTAGNSGKVPPGQAKKPGKKDRPDPPSCRG